MTGRTPARQFRTLASGLAYRRMGVRLSGLSTAAASGGLQRGPRRGNADARSRPHGWRDRGHPRAPRQRRPHRQGSRPPSRLTRRMTVIEQLCGLLLTSERVALRSSCRLAKSPAKPWTSGIGCRGSACSLLVTCCHNGHTFHRVLMSMGAIDLRSFSSPTLEITGSFSGTRESRGTTACSAIAPSSIR